MVGNTTFLIGSEDERVDRAKEVISKYSKTRTHTTPSTGTYGTNLRDGDLQKEIQVGGATVFVLGVDSMDKY